MILLSIDTSGPACSAALLADDRLLGEIVINSALTHSETIMPAVDELLSRENLTCADVDLFAVAAGPGLVHRRAHRRVRGEGHGARDRQALRAREFAGRAGRRAALCSRRRLPDSGRAPRAGVLRLLPLDGRGAAEKILPDAALPLTELLKALPENEIITFTGDGVAVHEARIRALLGERARFAPPHARVLRASSAAYWARLDSSCHMEARAADAHLPARAAGRARAQRKGDEGEAVSRAIRYAAPADFEVIYAIERACFPTPWEADVLAHDLSKNPCARYLLILEGEQVVGYGLPVAFDGGSAPDERGDSSGIPAHGRGRSAHASADSGGHGRRRALYGAGMPSRQSGRAGAVS